ncbi:putative two-component sensor histidine kinase with PAS/PAC domains [Candidatus Phaeomarinobacter ectocarpi]|uniref:histidine kinase n=1 Tax=Candidatus Phaeomarinibacter ectocarpi TaxID=1458461 RepID=X5MFP0_9HYPH|nr:PAS domain-containing sensor histidine kinase [Candidatus Phaeomarinobacter ectocarpi]CDO60014.1 putative two-component sensor histidine kinase with PAS/PAC domains [Candidatus Phaeomarinobacter ectocarpi]
MLQISQPATEGAGLAAPLVMGGFAVLDPLASASLVVLCLALAGGLILATRHGADPVVPSRRGIFYAALVPLVFAVSKVAEAMSGNDTLQSISLFGQIAAASAGTVGVVLWLVRERRARPAGVPAGPEMPVATPGPQQSTADLADLDNQRITMERLKTTLDGSGIVAFEQDEDLRYRWLFNAPNAADGESMEGRTDFDLFPADVAAQLGDVKKRVMLTKERETLELPVPVEDGEFWYRVDIAPLTSRGGVAAVATDVTALKESQGQLHVLMRELAHRIKNLLAVIDGIARQTAKHQTSVEGFEEVFSKRLRGLAATHDLLIQADWKPIAFSDLAKSQIVPTAAEAAKNVVFDGPHVWLPGDSAQHLGLAFHELTTNAIKHGALSVPGGQVSIVWDQTTKEGETWLDVAWQESGGPDVTEPEGAGFGTFLTTRAVESGLRGEVERSFAPDGFVWRVSFPLS